jgi:hypothetical protein
MILKSISSIFLSSSKGAMRALQLRKDEKDAEINSKTAEIEHPRQ